MQPSGFTELKNKVVVITGASAGVGAACARAFAAQGAKIVLVARGEDALNRIGDELRSVTEVLTVVMDVARADDCQTLFDKAEQAFGAVHILVNNAGLHVRGDFEKNTGTDYAAMVDINLRAPIVLTRLVLPYIRRSGGGAVVMVGSLAGIVPLQGAATYSATKAGLRYFTYALADELRDSGILVGLVAPGPIDTGFIMGNIDEVEDIVFSQPMSSAEQVAAAVVDIALNGKTEIPLPTASGLLSKVMALFPRFRRMLRPMLYKKGARNKEKYRHRRQ